MKCVYMMVGLLGISAASPVFGVNFDTMGANDQFYPMGITSDGSTIVGMGATNTSGLSAMKWTAATGPVFVGAVAAPQTADVPVAISGDGSTIVGYIQDVNNQRTAVRWDSAGNYTTLAGAENLSRSAARSVSGNGGVIVGDATFTSGPQGFRWTAGAGMQGAGFAPGGLNNGQGWAVSADGTTITGSTVANIGNGNYAIQGYLWTQTNGMQLIPRFPDAYNIHPTAISADGAIVYGDTDGSEGGMFRYTAQGGLQAFSIGQISVTGTSGDGKIVVGNEFNFTDGVSTETPVVWTEASGFLSVADFLSVNHLSLGGYTLGNVAGISQDGSTIFGRGSMSNGQPAGWVANVAGATYVPEPGALNLLGFGVLVGIVGRRGRRVFRAEKVGIL